MNKYTLFTWKSYKINRHNLYKCKLTTYNNVLFKLINNSMFIY